MRFVVTSALRFSLIIAMMMVVSVVQADVEKGVEALNAKNYDEAFKAFKSADKAGDVNGTYYLGLAYFSGWGVPKDVAHGVSLVRDAAEQGLAVAEYDLATVYRNGLGVERNHETAFAWFQRAGAQEHLPALMMLAYSYRDGVGVAVDGAEAERYFKRASKSDPKALMEIGMMYYNGKAVTKNFDKAAEMFKAGAKLNHPGSLVWLSHLYRTGEGVTANNEKRLKYLKQAADAGSGRAQFDLGMRHTFFGDADTDPVKAAYWFEKAALSGYRAAYGELSNALEQANWKVETEKSHVFWVEYLAKAGIAQQQWNYAHLLQAGQEVARDTEQALKYMLNAAEGGYSKAQLLVGQAYYEGGLGLEVDQDKGHEMIRGAALQEVPEAMKSMAVIYASGAGKERDAFVAYIWLLYAERAGAEDLEGLRSHLMPKIDGAMKREAKSRLANCHNLEHCTRPFREWGM